MNTNTEIKTILNEFVTKGNTGIQFDFSDNGGIELKAGKLKVFYVLEFVKNITRPVLALILSKTYKKKSLLVSDYINPVISEELKSNNLNFLDAQGNCFISSGNLYVYIKGMKKNNNTVVLRKNNYNITDIKLIFSLLADETLIKESQRHMAAASEIPLGSVGLILNKLREQNFLISLPDGYRLNNKQALFEKWCVAYNEKFRPKIFLGKFRGALSVNEVIEGKWSGESAAYLLKKLFKPELMTVYIGKEKLNKFLLTNRLIKDPAGNIEIYDSSWLNNDIDEKFNVTVHPFIIYADLLSTGNQRIIETAKTIYGDFIEDKLG